MLVSWVLYPLVLGLVTLGHGLVLQRVSGGRIPGVLLLPAGLGLLVVVVELAITPSGAAHVAIPLAVFVGLIGLALGQPWRERGLDRGAILAALFVFVVYGAPVVLSGHATFTGYIKLDDSATFWALADRALDHGRSLDGLIASSYQATLQAYMANGYPLGSVLPFAAVARVMGQ